MAKRKNNKNNKNTRSQGRPSASKASTKAPSHGKSPEQEVSDLEEAVDKLPPETVKEVTAGEPPEDASSADLIRRAWDVLKRSESSWADCEQRRDGLAEAEAKHRELEEGLERRQAELTEREQKLKAEEEDLLSRREDVVRRELDADAGFSKRNREALDRLEAEGEELRTALARHRSTMQEEREAFDREVREARARHADDAKAQLKEREDELAREREGQAEESSQLKKFKQKLEIDRVVLDEDREALDELIERRASRELELKDGELRALTERLEAARETRDQLQQKLDDRDEADRRFGRETPEQVLKRIQRLEQERADLQEALGGRPSAEAAQRLEGLVREKELWEADKLQLLEELGNARQEAARRRIAVTELESLRDQKRALESANALHHEANKQLRAEVDALIKGAEGKSPFPSCSAMDADGRLQDTPRTTTKIKRLVDFAEFVRHRMAFDPETKKELFYSREDIRSFLGGLAMSRLHLLQGISGTGKTSLPLAFARAIGCGSAVIEVQAGWRDRQDLIGHFNTFERRFYESEFLQALYRAATPKFRGLPFILVLDEMNLSHPEQYFADLLSALEQDQRQQRLVLMTAAVDPAPQLLAEGGKELRIPPNVWFVGTANHDETTKDFADKTYDRAHVMELPRNRATFEIEPIDPKYPYTLEALERAFDEAVQAHCDEAEDAYEFLQDQLGDVLGRRFGVGWGNRLERQMSRYVPVVISSGGTKSEATDHILATKLLRKIRDRHDNRPEDIMELRSQIKARWGVLEPGLQPHRSLDLLGQELHRLGHDES